MSTTKPRHGRRISHQPDAQAAPPQPAAANDATSKPRTKTPGRPRAKKAQRRDVVRSTKMTAAQAIELEARAAKAGMTVSSFLLHMGLHGSLVVRQTVINAQVDDNMVRQLVDLGQDLNSIAKSLNARHSYVPANLDQALKTYKRLAKQLKPLSIIPKDAGVQILHIANNLRQIKRGLQEWQSFVPEALSVALKTTDQLIPNIVDLEAAA